MSRFNTRRTRSGDFYLATTGDPAWPPAGTATWPPVGTFSWPRTQDRVTIENASVLDERSSLDMLRGHCAVAVARLEATAALPIPLPANRIEAAETFAVPHLWCGRPQ